LLLFLEKEEFKTPKICSRTMDFLGARPQTPRVGFAEALGRHIFCEAELTLFASFSGKRRV
jgi:hypothetical protein